MTIEQRARNYIDGLLYSPSPSLRTVLEKAYYAGYEDGLSGGWHYRQRANFPNIRRKWYALRKSVCTLVSMMRKRRNGTMTVKMSA